MEDMALKETWDWLEEDLRLDYESPLAISQSLWDDFAPNEAVVRPLFGSTPASHVKESVPSSFYFGHQDCPEPSSSEDAIRDWNPILKRRRMLQFPGEQMGVIPSLSESLENCSSSFIEVYGDFQAHRQSSSSSIWCLSNEESFGSANETVEQRAESWMADCFSDSDTSRVQDLANRCPLDFGAPMVATAAATGACSNSRQASCGMTTEYRSSMDYVDAYSSRQASSASKPVEALLSPQHAHSQGKQPRDRSLHIKSQLGKKPVAYPFAVVKPSGIQGDITLKDINKRIMAPPTRPRTLGKCETPRISSASLPSGLTASGKSVLARTKIYTGGKGTITIMRTRS